MITDVALDSTNPLIAKQPPDMSDPFLARFTRAPPPSAPCTSARC